MTVIDDPFWRREWRYPLRVVGIGTGLAVLVGAGLYMAFDATARSQDHIKKFVQALAQNKENDIATNYHLLIAYNQWDSAQQKKGGAFSLARRIPQAEIDEVMEQLKREASQDRQQQLRERYNSMDLANHLAGECRDARIKYHFMRTGPHPSVDDLVAITLSNPPIVPTHILYTYSAVDPAVASSVEQKYSRATHLKPESLWVTNTTIEDIPRK